MGKHDPGGTTWTTSAADRALVPAVAFRADRASWHRTRSLKRAYDQPAETCRRVDRGNITPHPLFPWGTRITCRRSGELSEISRRAAVHFRDRVGVVAQGGGPTAAVTEAGGGVAQVDAAG